MEKDTTPVDIIRENLRKIQNENRVKSRDAIVNVKRGALGFALNVCERRSLEDITTLATKLKTRNKITLPELTALQNALIQDEKNICAFFHVNGSLHALIREVSGQKADFQYVAASCCCNLALGDPHLCLLLSKAALPYFMSHINGLNLPLSDVCLWTLGNLAGSDVKCWSMLKSQGFLPNILKLIESDVNVESSIYALTHYVNTGFDDMESSEYENIATISCSLLKSHPSIYWLLYLLSCSEACEHILIEQNVIETCVNILYYELFDKFEEEKNLTSITALLRTIGNLCTSSSEQGVKRLLPVSNEIINILKGCFMSSVIHIQKECLWVLGNLVNSSCDCSKIITGVEHGINNALKQIDLEKFPECN